MNIQEKTRLGLRILKYFKGTGCEVQLLGRDRCTTIISPNVSPNVSPSVFVYKIKGDWSRRFQHKIGLFKYTCHRYEITHEKFLANFAEWYCSPQTINLFKRLMIESAGSIYMPIADSLEELSLQMAVHGY